MQYGITQCYLPPGNGDFPPLPQPKLILDLSTPKAYKAELTLVVVISQDSLPATDGHLSQKDNQAVSWPGIAPEAEIRKRDCVSYLSSVVTDAVSVAETQVSNLLPVSAW